MSVNPRRFAEDYPATARYLAVLSFVVALLAILQVVGR